MVQVLFLIVECNQNLCRCEKENELWVLSPKACLFFSVKPTSWTVQSKGFYNKPFLLCRSDPCGSGSSKLGDFLRGWGNPFQLAHMESILTIKNGNLWKTAADSNSDLFDRRWVMSTLKPLEGREWGSPVGSYHSWFPLGNRTVSVCLTWVPWGQRHTVHSPSAGRSGTVLQ